MLNSYEALVKGNKLDWIDIPPKEILENKKIKVKIIVNEQVQDKSNRGKIMADALKKISQVNGLKSIKNPVSWQRELRKDRTLER